MSRLIGTPATVAVLALVLVIGLAACTTDGSPTPAANGGGNGGGEGGGGGEAVDVSLVEFEIDMPMTVPAGMVTFNVSNDGTMTHAFEVEGNGIEEETDTLSAGDTATLEVELEPGTYTVYCPVGNHREMGMELQLEVTES